MSHIMLAYSGQSFGVRLEDLISQRVTILPRIIGGGRVFISEYGLHLDFPNKGILGIKLSKFSIP